MPNYTAVFDLLGAFARVRAQLLQNARANVEIAEGALTFRSLDNLAQRLTGLLNDSPEQRRLLPVIERLRALGASLEAAWPAFKTALDAVITGPVAAELNVGGDPRAVLAALARAMDADGESIRRGATGIGVVDADPDNAGNGECYATILTPWFGDTSRASQLTKTQGVEILCDADAPNDGLTPGGERWIARGSGGLAGVLLTVPVTAGDAEHERNLVIDGSFTVYDAPNFARFAASGEPLFSQHAADALFHNAALRVNGAGSATLRQILSDRSTPPAGGRMVALGAWVKVIAINAGTLTLRLVADGVNLSPALEYDAASPSGAWSHAAIFVSLPRMIYPSELKLDIATDASFDGEALIDGLSVVAAEPLGDGAAGAIFQGPEPFQRGPAPDRFTFSTENDDAGAFSAFLRDVYGVELPASDTPTIDDAAAI